LDGLPLGRRSEKIFLAAVRLASVVQRAPGSLLLGRRYR
jgi:hypothetical protein